MGDASTPISSDALPASRWLRPDTEEFKQRRTMYCAHNLAVPQAILCPRNADEVSAIVRLARDSNTPFSVRTGGHDVHGRSIVHDALCIDMRDINSVDVAEDRKTAVIGGGIQFGKLLADLHTHGLITPHGSVPSIGYFGWASFGGYGSQSSRFGLGVDQILEAEVVNDQGHIVKADEEMLKGIRGAGGNFGIVTSLRIKVYEVNMLLGGFLMFDTSAGISQAFKETILKLQELDASGVIPPEVVLQPLVLNHPEAGRVLGITYIWTSDDHDRGRKKLDEIVHLLPVKLTMNTVSSISAPDWLNVMDGFISKSAWGGSQAISFGQLSPQVLDTMGEGLEEMPSDPGTCFCLHVLARCSPSVTNPSYAEGSCFNPEARQAHTLVEIIGSALSEDSMARCGEWARSMREALFARGEAMQGTYVSLIGPGIMSLENLYGEKTALLRTLKRKYDPDNVFKYAIPDLTG